MKKLKRIGIIVLMMALMSQTIIYGFVTTTITKNEPVVTLTNQGERIFDIGYEFDVDFEQVTTGLDIVLVLDRSNSMLRQDPSSGLPVAQAVWDAVNDFVTEVYTAYPDSNIAIVSFGTNANKSDNWKYYYNLEDTLDEIAVVFEYRDLNTDYNSNYKSYWNNGYRFAWEYWQISDGATNIAAAFDYAATTIVHKEIHGDISEQDVIILFTDGVATQGGSRYQKNYNYPTEHNTNTIAAYTAGQAAQSEGEIITVGYFEGIEYEATKQVARETLSWSSSAGAFEASQTGQLTNIFDTIVEELNYIGTDATVVEIIEDEFEVVEGSIQPGNYTVTTDAEGRQIITWQLGTVQDANYTFGYQVRVKDDVYPTGSGTIEIPINQQAMLYYTDLDGNSVSEPLGQNFTTIPPRDNVPQVTATITYLNNQFGYLVGDEIGISHELNFENQAPFDYRTIDVNSFGRSLVAGNVSDVLTLSQESIDAGWTLSEGAYIYSISDSHTATGDENLVWSSSVPVTFIASGVGNYQLDYHIDYELTNSVGIVYPFISMGLDPDVVDVKEGQVVLNLVDNVGVNITDVTVMVDNVVATTTVDENNNVVVHNIPSGLHTITFEKPSGYNLLTVGEGITIDGNQMMSFDATVSYDEPIVSKTIEFERLNVRDIVITTRDNAHSKALDQLNETVDAKMSFTLTRALVKVSMNMVDDFGTSDHIFTLDTNGVAADVRNELNQVVPGFVMNGNRLEYEGAELPIGTYVAYGVLTSPALGEGLDYDYNVDVDSIITREAGDPSDTAFDMTSNGLFVELVDTEGPVIVATHDEEASTINLINQDIDITDKTEIVTYEVYNGTLTYEELLLEDTVLPVEVVEDLGNALLLDGNIPVILTVENGSKITRGSITIYAVDAFGNHSLLVVDYENLDVNQLLDEDLV